MNHRADYGTKRCRACEQTLPLDRFGKKASNKDGRSGRCRPCMRTYFRDYRERNSEALRARYGDRVAAYNRKYYRANPSCEKERRRSWAASNEAKVLIQAYMQRARKYGIAEPAVENFTRQDVAERYGDGCFYCRVGDFDEVDHFIAVRRGGGHTLENARPACVACNRTKNSYDRMGDAP